MMVPRNRAPALVLRLNAGDDATLPAGGATVYGDALKLLYVAQMTNVWQQQAGNRNLAKNHAPGIFSGAVSHFARTIGAASPLGPAFDLTAGNTYRQLQSGADYYTPVAKGGHHPCTLWGMYSLTTTPGGDVMIWGITGGNGPRGIGIKTNASRQPQGYLRHDTDGGGLNLTGTAVDIGHTVSCAFTSRGLTDHAFAIHVLETGHRELVTSSTSRNAATANPGNQGRLGYATGNADVWFFDDGHVYGAAFIDAPLSTDDLMTLAVMPFSMIEASRRPRFLPGSPVPPVALARPRVSILGGRPRLMVA
jgi:hypothetical protein